MLVAPLRPYVYAGGHEHHSDAGKQQQRVVFSFLLFFDLQVFHGEENHQRGGGQEKRCEEKEERIDQDRLMESGEFAPCRDCSSELPKREGAEKSARQSQPGIPVFFFLLDPEIDYQNA